MSKCAKKIKIVCCFILIIILLLGCLTSCKYFNFNKKISLNKELGVSALNIVKNAQYKPDLEKFVKINEGKTISFMGLSNEEDEQYVSMTADAFNSLVNKYAAIENYSGSGKYQGYDIHEVKNEIAFVLDKVPAFGQWFEMPIMREEQGFISIPYYEGWNYYVEMDENKLSITRRSGATRSEYLDFEDRVSVEYHSDDTAFRQYEVMRINYFLNGDGDEVVECMIYTVGVDHYLQSQIGDGYNDNPQNYYPLEYIYLKNVKDKEFIKYHITAAPRYREEDSFDEGGMDIRGNTPYGIRREYMVANYDGYSKIDVLDVNQQFSSLDYPSANGSVFFDISSNNAKKFATCVGVSDEEYAQITTPKDFMDVTAKIIVDNFALKHEWHTINTSTINAPQAETIIGPFYGKKLPISSLSIYLDNTKPYVLDFSAHANVPEDSPYTLDDSYSLDIAIRNIETNEYVYIGNNDENILERNVLYRPSSNTTLADYTTNITISSNAFQVTEEGEYEVTCIFSKNGTRKFDTLLNGYLRRYEKLCIPDKIVEDTKYSYYINPTGGKLVIKCVSSRIMQKGSQDNLLSA
ncbi:MAG: hypothetical protein IJ033_00595 [Clostridia bacterium]|nr:hypothetical protein [Clostridia bacterium]